MNPLNVTKFGKIRTKNISYMDRELKFWLAVGFVLVLFAWVLALASCVSRPSYTIPSGVQVELPHTPADTLKGGAR